MKPNILFLCTGNSCRSQMAHGFAIKYFSEKYNFYSAGIKTHGLNQRAVAVMKELDIDISSHTSNLLSEYDHLEFKSIITVCAHAHETCPVMPGCSVIHIGFEDPPYLTKDMSDEEEILKVYRRVRDEINSFVQNIEKHLV